jgi:hypothetical protein
MSDPEIVSAPPKPEAWENEGGSLASPEDAERLGVVRHLTETYSVGEFRYTSLTDAVAQARRMAKPERELRS